MLTERTCRPDSRRPCGSGAARPRFGRINSRSEWPVLGRRLLGRGTSRMLTIFGHQVCATLTEVLDPAWTAVLPIDLQNDFMDARGKVALAGGDVTAMQELRLRCSEFIRCAREFGIPVVHIRIADLPDGASDSPSWIRSKMLMSNDTEFAVEGTWGAEFVEECQPVDGELVITKRRSSAFTGTGLAAALRERNIQTVVIIGEQTPGCVE